MKQTDRRRSSPLTGVRVTTVITMWLGIVFLAAPLLNLYYVTLAAWYSAPPLILTYAYCVSHRCRATALLAVVATIVAVMVVAFAVVIPKATTA